MKKLHAAFENIKFSVVISGQIATSPSDVDLGSPDNDASSIGKVAITSQQPRSLTRRANLTFKRLIDIVVSSVALVALSPALIWLAVLIPLESRGSPIFTQVRWGRNRSTFRVYKFRTMFIDKCDPGGVNQTEPGDSRVTRIGAILRRTNVDELPQLINVLKGDMSLVGPRCHPIGMRAGGMPYEELVRSYHRRHEMRPGITGLAQANGYRGSTVDANLAVRRVQFDLEYIRNFSVWMDVKIIITTLANEIRGGGTGT